MNGMALVTGARRGIGKAIAITLARDGFDLAVNDVTASPELDAVVAEIKTMGRKAIAVIGDISKTETHDAMLDVAENLRSLTTLVNNAGVSVLNRGDLLDVLPESFDRCMDINARGTFFLCQAFARRLLKRSREGMHHSIITISSRFQLRAVSIACRRPLFQWRQNYLPADFRMRALEFMKFSRALLKQI
jgi:NAD(P)-dependent dehydrogenase (short-subunit alcohol dehydrogenase family)